MSSLNLYLSFLIEEFNFSYLWLIQQYDECINDNMIEHFVICIYAADEFSIDDTAEQRFADSRTIWNLLSKSNEIHKIFITNNYKRGWEVAEKQTCITYENSFDGFTLSAASSIMLMDVVIVFDRDLLMRKRWFWHIEINN